MNPRACSWEPAGFERMPATSAGDAEPARKSAPNAATDAANAAAVAAAAQRAAARAAAAAELAAAQAALAAAAAREAAEEGAAGAGDDGEGDEGDGGAAENNATGASTAFERRRVAARCAALCASAADLEDPGHQELIAREQYGYVMPGEVPYVVVPPNRDTSTFADTPEVEAEVDRPWFRRAWDTVTGLFS